MLVRSIAAPLLAALALVTPVLAVDVRIEVTGIVTAVTGTLPGALQTAAVGETFEAVVHVIDQPIFLTPNQWEYPTDDLQGYLRIGASVAPIYTGGTGVVTLTDEAVDGFVIGVPITGGIVIGLALGFVDINGTALSSPDINDLIGATLSPVFNSGSIVSQLPTANLDLTVTQFRFFQGSDPQFGTSYCDAQSNSIQREGTMAAIGSPTVAANDALLIAYNLPNNSFGFFLGSRAMGLVANPGGSSGDLCLGGSIGRFVGPGQIQSSGTIGRIDLQLDLLALPTPTGPVPALAGDDWYFALWYRDFENGMVTSNFTDGLAVVFQ